MKPKDIIFVPLAHHDSHVSWQVDRRDKSGGRVDDRNALFLQGAQVRAPDLTVLTH